MSRENDLRVKFCVALRTNVRYNKMIVNALNSWGKNVITRDEYKTIRQERHLIVLDTNILLELYRGSRQMSAGILLPDFRRLQIRCIFHIRYMRNIWKIGRKSAGMSRKSTRS